MEAQDLRIGNWYLSTRFQTPVICEMGDFYEIYARADGSSEYTVDDIFQSIPLTEEWLLKFGFEYDNETSGWDNEKLSSDYDSEIECYYILFYVDNSIKYVHQLQNIYFALTGEELTIK